MNEARDIVGISVPFAAGVAMGVALYPLLSGGLPFITSSILLVLICITTLLVRFGKLGDRSGKRLVSLSNQPRLGRLMRLGRLSGRRIFFAGIFIVTGIFCSLNYHIAQAGFLNMKADSSVRRRPMPSVHCRTSLTIYLTRPRPAAHW